MGQAKEALTSGHPAAGAPIRTAASERSAEHFTEGDQVMRSKIRSVVALALVVMLLAALAPFPALAAENKTYVSGTLQLIAINPPGYPPATMDFLGGGKFRLVEWTTNQDIFSDPRLSGIETMHLVLMGDWTTGSGKTWGSNEIVNDAGSWSGHFAGRVDGFVWTYHATLVGKGAYHGLVANLDYTGYQDGAVPNAIFQITGYIVETGPNP
jgi:hypothetical protein